MSESKDQLEHGDVTELGFIENSNELMLNYEGDTIDNDDGLDIQAKTKDGVGGVLGLGKLKKKAQTLSAMSKNLTGGAGNLLGGVANLSKDYINKL